MKQIKIYYTVAFLLLSLTSFSQKISKGNVLGISEIEIKLNDDMTFEQFERFYLEEYIPAISKNFPGTKGFLLKGER